MARATYDSALVRLLAHEGGYTNHPSDPGGPTNFGITIHDYRRYLKPGAAAADVRAMKIDEAKAIYRSKYWDAVRCDDLPAGLDYAVVRLRRELGRRARGEGAAAAARAGRRRPHERRGAGRGARPRCRDSDRPAVRRAYGVSQAAEDLAGVRRGLGPPCARGEGGRAHHGGEPAQLGSGHQRPRCPARPSFRSMRRPRRAPRASSQRQGPRRRSRLTRPVRERRSSSRS